MTAKQQPFPEPEFADSAELRKFCNDVRRAMHLAAMLAHTAASEMEAALSQIEPADPTFLDKMFRKRRAKKVSKHMRYVADCLVAAGAGSVRCWGAFRQEYAPELTPVRGRKPNFKVVPE